MEESLMVMEKARPHLKSLAELAPQLNEATDRYMDELKAIEAELRNLNLGLEVELDEPLKTSSYKKRYDDDGDPTGARYYDAWCLGYARIEPGLGWGFVVRSYEVQEESRGEWEEGDVTPLLQASRDLRLAAAEQIPTLLDTLEKAAKEKIEALKKVSDR